MNGLEAVRKLEALSERIEALYYAEKFFEEKEMGSGAIFEMRKELTQERDELIDKLRRVNI